MMSVAENGFVRDTSLWDRNERLMAWAPAIPVLLALLLHADDYVTTDVSWLITVCERLLAGDRLYVDILETNPPFSVYLYMAPVAVAQILGTHPERMVLGFVFAFAIGAAIVSARMMIVARLLPARQYRAMLFWLLLIFLVLPNETFAQREHIGLMAVVPMFVTIAWRVRRAGGGSLPIACYIFAGSGAAILMAVKPYYGISIFLPQVFAAIRTRSAAPLIGLENWIAGSILLSYVALTFNAFPEFVTGVMPDVVRTYMNVWTPPSMNPFLALFVLQATVFLAYLAMYRNRSPLATVSFLAAIGLLAIFYWLGKGFPYHGFPCVAALGLALADFACGGQKPPMKSNLRAAMLVIIALGFFVPSYIWFRAPDLYAGRLISDIRRLAPNPTIMTLSYDIAAGHPLNRQVNARWVGSMNAAWRLQGAQFQLLSYPDLDPVIRNQMEEFVQTDLSTYLLDIERHKPDIIILDWRNPLLPNTVNAHPQLRRALMEYSSLGRYGMDDYDRGLELLIRTSKLAKSGSNGHLENSPLYPSG